MRKKRNIHRKQPLHPIYKISPTQTTLFRNCTQLRPKFSTPTTPLLQAPSRRLPKLLVGKRERGDRRASRSRFFSPSGAGLDKRGASLDGECGHLLRVQRLVEPVQGQGKVKVAELEVVVVMDGVNGVVEVHVVGVANESGGVFV